MQHIFVFLTAVLMISIILPHSSGRAADKEELFRTISKTSVSTHIVPRYKNLAAAGVRLHASAQTYCKDRTAGSFTALHSSFRDYWIAWAGIRHVQFGPIQVQNRGFRIQFWPDFRNKTGKQLSRVLAAEDRAALDEETFSKTSVAVQGLPALERLLANGHQGVDGAADSFKCALTETIAHNLSRIASTLSADWNPQNGYAHIISMAGSAGSPYSEAREVPVELMQGLIAELEASHDVRLGRPLGATQDKARPKLAEAWRSGLSKAILLESVKSIADIYRNGGLDQALREVGETALADRIITGFETIIAQTDALDQSLPEAFTTAQDRKKLKAIRADLKVLTGLLSTDLAVALGIPPGFNSRDGD